MPTASGKPTNYTTSKHPRETSHEIMAMLAKYGAERCSMAWEKGDPVAVEFTMRAPIAGQVREVPVRLEPKVDGLRERLKDVSGASDPEWVAWRQLKDLIDAQLEAAENGVREFHEIFLSDILVEAEVGGELTVATVGELMGAGGALPGGAKLLEPAQ